MAGFFRKRKTPNDSEDDAPAARRMRDLTDIGSPPKPTTGQMTRSRQAHHDATAAAAAKRSKVPPTVDQVDNNLPCGALRKKDRSRPLSELCNGVKPSNGLDTSLDKFKPEQPKGVNGTSCVPRPLDDAFAHGPVDQPVDAPIAAATTILKADHLHAHQPCAPTKAPPTWECTKRASNCSKDGMSSQCDSRNPKKKTTSSAGHEGGGRTRKGRTAKQKAAPINEVILLKRRTAKSAATPDEDDKSLVVMLPDALVHAALRQRSEIKCEPEEPSGTIGRHHSNGETSSVPPVVSEPAPPQRRDLRCHVAVKPTKTLQLNPSLYDVEISSGPGCGGGSKGRHVPLVSLMSRSSRRPVVGYPVSVERSRRKASEDELWRPHSKEEETAAPRPVRVRRSVRRKAGSEDESWRPHSKKPAVAVSAAVSSPRKMRRLSSLGATSQRGGDDEERRRRRKGPGAGQLVVACVPVRVVFSRIKEALEEEAEEEEGENDGQSKAAEHIYMEDLEEEFPLSLGEEKPDSTPPRRFVAHTGVVIVGSDTSTYNSSMAKTEINRSGINELYPALGQAEAAAAAAAVAASSAAFLSALSFSAAARSAAVDMGMTRAART
ncbi:hypothetical protein TRIUR3_27759 [Triticum urartu]|uniref:Uncharacterized protein n=1 Tax=Triticum urartu TaxID=4572 RepID=M7YTV7_TRIUA|nr:hypothetical protein TRIUR3_27759 [Triticum urartu]